MDKELTKNELKVFLKDKKSFKSYDVISFFAITRTLLEFYEKKEIYKVLNMYSNWVLHKELSHTSSSYKFIFKTISESLNNYWGDNQKILENISSGIGLEKLGFEISSFINDIYGEELLKKSTIKELIEIMGYVIINRPIKNNTNKGLLKIVDSKGCIVKISKIEITEGIKNSAIIDIYVVPRPPKHLNDYTPFLRYELSDFNI